MFIQVIRGKLADEAGFRKTIDRFDTEVKPGAIGYLGTTAGVLDGGGFVICARFESEDLAMQNSDRPEQGAFFAEASKNFDGEPTFYNVTDIEPWLAGGSDDAGFVQVIQGRVSDPERFRHFMEQPMDMLHEQRPEIIGGTIAMEPDGWFTETVAFRSEDEAREGERKEMPEEARRDWEQEMATMRDVTYLDLHHPWFASAPSRGMSMS